MSVTTGKIERSNKLLNSHDEPWLLSQIASLSAEANSGSGFAKHCLILLSSSQFPTVSEQAAAALQQVS